MWRPIEIAPKDGTAIFLYLKEAIDRRYCVTAKNIDSLTIGFWDRNDWVSIETEDCGSMGGEMTGWMTDYTCLEIKPTHWMPLPALP